MRLLNQTNMKIPMIASACGYRTPAQLQKIFRGETGYPLEAYRKAMHGDV